MNNCSSVGTPGNYLDNKVLEAFKKELNNI